MSNNRPDKKTRVAMRKAQREVSLRVEAVVRKNMNESIDTHGSRGVAMQRNFETKATRAYTCYNRLRTDGYAPHSGGH